jgi:hypothetical protein
MTEDRSSAQLFADAFNRSLRQARCVARVEAHPDGAPGFFRLLDMSGGEIGIIPDTVTVEIVAAIARIHAQAISEGMGRGRAQAFEQLRRLIGAAPEQES